MYKCVKRNETKKHTLLKRSIKEITKHVRSDENKSVVLFVDSYVLDLAADVSAKLGEMAKTQEPKRRR